jgi:excisionase family DNA binding protein
MRTRPETHDRLHSVESAAEFLGGVSPYTIRAWLTEGRLTRIKVGRLTRVRESELSALIKPEMRAVANGR